MGTIEQVAAQGDPAVELQRHRRGNRERDQVGEGPPQPGADQSDGQTEIDCGGDQGDQGEASRIRARRVTAGHPSSDGSSNTTGSSGGAGAVRASMARRAGRATVAR